MDNVFKYKEELIKYLSSLPEDSKTILSTEDIFYLMVSDEVKENDILLKTAKKLLTLIRHNEVSSNVASLKKFINFTSFASLSDYLNKNIYDLLTIDQIIKKNNEILQEEYNNELNNMNNNLLSSYQNEKQIILQKILNEKER